MPVSKIQAKEHKEVVVRTFNPFTIAIPREFELQLPFQENLNYNNNKTSTIGSYINNL